MIRDLLWRIVAFIVTRRAVSDWLIARARRTPYSNITSRDGRDTYMVRLWLFNPYGRTPDGEQGPARWSWFPSIRLHHILRADDDDHLHDHPWNARTIVLHNWYREHRVLSYSFGGRYVMDRTGKVRHEFVRERGYTGRLLYGQYHRISEVAPGGVWTMFITWKKLGGWGFLVNGQKVPWRKYLGLERTS